MQEKGDFDVELGHPYMIWEGHGGGGFWESFKRFEILMGSKKVLKKFYTMYG